MLEATATLLRMAFSACLFCLSCYGWGKLFCKSLRLRCSRFLWPALGIPPLLVLFGPLVLCRVADRTVLLAAVVIGGVFGAVDIYQHVRLVPMLRGFRESRESWAYCVVFIGFLGILGGSALGGFAMHADRVGYAVNVARLLQAGRYGPDPFNARMAITSLGGQNVLLGLLASTGLSLYQLRILERAIVPVFLFLALWGMLRDVGARPLIRWWVILLNMYLVILLGVGGGETKTLTGTFTSIPLYLCLLWVVLTEPLNSYRTMLCLAFLCASAILLKGSQIVILAMLIFAIVLSFHKSAWSLRQALRWGMLAVAVILTLLPWMLNLRISNGTLLYPFLGQGYYGARYGTYYSPSIMDTLKDPYALMQVFQLCLLLVPLMAVGFMSFRLGCPELHFPCEHMISLSRLRIGLWGLLPLGAMILLAETGAIRYTGTPVLLLGVVTGMWWAVVASRREDNLRVVARKHWVLAIVFIVVLINPARTSIGELSRDIKRGLATAGAMPEPISQKAVQKVQQVVPAGSLILARMGQAYFLDFSRNPIWHLDMPGASSLPPGLPLNKNVDAVRAYFRQCGIRYVMYSEIDDGGH